MQIRKYFKIYKVFIENSFSFEAQYRKDTILKMLINFLWIGLLFLTIEVFFNNTEILAGWNKPEVYLLILFWAIADELFICLFSNLFQISDLVTDGKLDFFLAKPVNTLFVVSTKFFLVRALYRLCIWLIILVWLLFKFSFSISFLNAILSGMLVFIAIMVDYSFVLIANTLSFWFMRIDNINDAISSVRSFGRYPVEILPKAMRYLSFTVLPIAFIAYIPVATLLGRLSGWLVLYAFVFGILLLVLAIKFWNFALKKYTSASS